LQFPRSSPDNQSRPNRLWIKRIDAQATLISLYNFSPKREVRHNDGDA
jgi:hypothetical protein